MVVGLWLLQPDSLVLVAEAPSLWLLGPRGHLWEVVLTSRLLGDSQAVVLWLPEAVEPLELEVL